MIGEAHRPTPMVRVRRPGYMGRAIIAWIVLNVAMLLVLGIMLYMLTPWLTYWFTTLPILIGVVITEWLITTDTIAPIIKEWIIQEETIELGKKPS